MPTPMTISVTEFLAALGSAFFLGSIIGWRMRGTNEYFRGVEAMQDRFRDGIAWQEEQEAARDAGDMTRAKILGKANW